MHASHCLTCVNYHALSLKFYFKFFKSIYENTLQNTTRTTKYYGTCESMKTNFYEISASNTM